MFCSENNIPDNHLSGIRITPNLKRFFQARRTPQTLDSILHPVGVYLNRYFSISTVSSYLAIAPSPVSVAGDEFFDLHSSIGCIFLWSCSTDSRRPEFLRRSVLGCTDFPHLNWRDYPAALFYIIFYYKKLLLFGNIL